MGKPFKQTFTIDGKLITSVVVDYDEFISVVNSLDIPSEDRTKIITSGMIHFKYVTGKSDDVFSKYDIPHDHTLGLIVRTSQLGEQFTITYDDQDKLPEELAALQRVYEALPSGIRSIVDSTADILSTASDPESIITNWSESLPTQTGIGAMSDTWRYYVKQVVDSARITLSSIDNIPNKKQFLEQYFKRLLGSSAAIWLEHAKTDFKALEQFD